MRCGDSWPILLFLWPSHPEYCRLKRDFIYPLDKSSPTPFLLNHLHQPISEIQKQFVHRENLNKTSHSCPVLRTKFLYSLIISTPDIEQEEIFAGHGSREHKQRQESNWSHNTKMSVLQATKRSTNRFTLSARWTDSTKSHKDGYWYLCLPITCASKHSLSWSVTVCHWLQQLNTMYHDP